MTHFALVEGIIIIISITIRRGSVPNFLCTMRHLHTSIFPLPFQKKKKENIARAGSLHCVTVRTRLHPCWCLWGLLPLPRIWLAVLFLGFDGRVICVFIISCTLSTTYARTKSTTHWGFLLVSLWFLWFLW
jgi:hypothetical protein